MRRFLLLAGMLVGAAAPAWANETITYTYDEHGRLVQVVHSGSVNNNETAQYSYDKVDNRTQVQVTNAPH